jgi:hypothetical protein
MRKFILISALLLASASAQAGETRGLILASAEQPNSVEKVEPVKPEAAKVDVKSEATPEASTSTPVASTPEATKPVQKSPVVRHESDEAKARRIAARYGISW